MSLKFDPISSGLVLSKPLAQESYDQSVIYELERKSELIITRKRDGWKLMAVIYKNKIKFYTVGLNEIDERLDHIRKELASLKLPSGTILTGEAIIEDGRGNDLYTRVISYFQSSKPPLASNSQLPKLMIFNILFFGGDDLSSKSYEENLGLIGGILSKKSFKYVLAVPVISLSYDDAKTLVVNKSWEGLVLYDRYFKFAYRLDGKNPNRPKGCYKWKPVYEDDFIVRGWNPSKNDPSKLKEVDLYQIDPVTSLEFRCGSLGSFTNKMKEFLKNSIIYPIVMKVEFEARFPKTGKIRNARFVEIRTDKKPSECLAPRSYAA